MRDAVHHDLERNRDLLFDLFRRNPRPLRNDLYVVVGYIGIGLNGQPLERNDASGKKDQRQSQDEQPVVERKIDDAANHLLLRTYCSTVFCSAKALETT